MLRVSTSILLFLASISYVSADIQFTVPAAGKSYDATTALTVTWTDSGVAPSISDLTAYQLFLYTGSNTAPIQLTSLTTASFSAGNTVSVTIPLGIAGIATNAYFLGMISTAAAGGTVTNYSPRFSLTGMTGTFSDAMKTANAAVTTTDKAPTVNNVAAAAASPASSGAAQYDVPYNEQVGTIRYAPMQPVPGTAITATKTAPLWPTSSVSLASTYLGAPSVVTTLTQAQTFSVASHANTAAAQSQPTDDMAKFLARWKD